MYVYPSCGFVFQVVCDDLLRQIWVSVEGNIGPYYSGGYRYLGFYSRVVGSIKTAMIDLFDYTYVSITEATTTTGTAFVVAAGIQGSDYSRIGTLATRSPQSLIGSWTRLWR